MGIFGIIGMIIVGFIVGLLARFFYPGCRVPPANSASAMRWRRRS